MSSIGQTSVTSDRGARAAARRVLGLTFLPVWGSSGTLAACLFLPLCLLPSCQIQGCGAAATPPPPPAPLSPYELYDGVEALRELFVLTTVAQWPYFFGGSVCAATLFIAATGQARYFRSLWFCFAIIISVSSIGLWWHVGRELRGHDKPESADRLSETLIVIVPTILFCLTLVVTYFNCRTWLAAVTWVQFALAVYGLAWFTLVDYIFPLLWGGRLSQVACLVLAVASLVERRRGFKTLGVRPP